MLLADRLAEELQLMLLADRLAEELQLMLLADRLAEDFKEQEVMQLQGNKTVISRTVIHQHLINGMQMQVSLKISRNTLSSSK
jgi:hypothetical protein